MIVRKSLFIAAALLLPFTARAQQGQGSTGFQIRSVLHDPVHPTAELFLSDASGKITPLTLVPEGLSTAQTTIPVNGAIVLYNTAAVDPKNPQASVAATVKIPANTKRAIMVVLPGNPDSKSAYRAVLIDDSQQGFPKGESRVLSLLGVDTAIEAGEHKLPVPAGKITNVPAVKKVNEFNMAQTNFYYKEGTSWVAFTERQLQYIDQFRRVFIVHVTPGSTFPSVTSVVDTAPAVIPAPAR